jgi:hypothetical protein
MSICGFCDQPISGVHAEQTTVTNTVGSPTVVVIYCPACQSVLGVLHDSHKG